MKAFRCFPDLTGRTQAQDFKGYEGVTQLQRSPEVTTPRRSRALHLGFEYDLQTPFAIPDPHFRGTRNVSRTAHFDTLIATSQSAGRG